MRGVHIFGDYVDRFFQGGCQFDTGSFIVGMILFFVFNVGIHGCSIISK